MYGLQERVEPNKKTRRQSPRTDGGQTAPASFTHQAPAPSLRPNQPSRSGFEVAARDEGVLPGRAFGAGSLTLLDGFHHGPVRFKRHGDPLCARGELGAGKHQALGAANGRARTRFISHRNMGLLARSTSYERPRSGPDNGQNEWRAGTRIATRLSSGVTDSVHDRE